MLASDLYKSCFTFAKIAQNEKTTTWDFSKTGLQEITTQPTERTIYSDLGATTFADFAADAISIQLNSTSGNALEEGKNCRIGSV